MRSWLGWRSRKAGRRRINLALQGGGSHGAFTWGVLDRLLEEEDVYIEGISGASAGAMNAVVFADGWLRGRHEGAKEALSSFWREVGKSARGGPLQPTPMDYLISGWNRDWSPTYLLLKTLAKVASPYQLNPGGFNPLIQMLASRVDFEALRRSRELKLFISATNVHSGHLRIMRNPELSPEVVAASACLPLLFQAVKLDDGHHYWDGGYTANPALFPLILECRARDLLLIQLSPTWQSEVPIRVSEIVDRTNEISFNANLLRELHFLALMEREFVRHWLPVSPMQRRLRQLKLHQIHTDGAVEHFGQTSRINAEWPFLLHLRDLGRAQTESWLENHRSDLGRHSTLKLKEFL